MATIGVDVPEEILALLKASRLGDRPVSDQVRIALAIHLFQEGVVSIGKAAEVAEEPRATFELMLGEMGIPAVRYDLTTYREDREAMERARPKQA